MSIHVHFYREQSAVTLIQRGQHSKTRLGAETIAALLQMHRSWNALPDRNRMQYMGKKYCKLSMCETGMRWYADMPRHIKEHQNCIYCLNFLKKMERFVPYTCCQSCVLSCVAVFYLTCSPLLSSSSCMPIFGYVPVPVFIGSLLVNSVPSVTV